MLSTLPTAPPAEALPGTELCPACHHPQQTHDAIGSRWCAVTSLSAGDRACLCSREVSGARVLRHY